MRYVKSKAEEIDPEVRHCQVCRKKFIARTATHKTCSQGCRLALHVVRHYRPGIDMSICLEAMVEWAEIMVRSGFVTYRKFPQQMQNLLELWHGFEAELKDYHNNKIDTKLSARMVYDETAGWLIKGQKEWSKSEPGDKD